MKYLVGNKGVPVVGVLRTDGMLVPIIGLKQRKEQKSRRRGAYISAQCFEDLMRNAFKEVGTCKG